eukprot:TRINITY_DN526_c0_g1_i1.p1 TRINITY_DN526_c0_g1~~TRINITY_DN526_c0_g1_i1.p1  ORF type:complete len:1536 (+),score=661.88 TRINITY_DN526_c0_g1_i1:185-4792(+)
MSDSEDDFMESDGDDFEFLDEDESPKKKKAPAKEKAPKEKAPAKEKPAKAAKEKSAKATKSPKKDKPAKKAKDPAAKPKKAKKAKDDSDDDAGSVNVSMEKSPAKSKKKKTIEETYTKLDQIEHALTRPDMYIGAAKIVEAKMWVYDKGGKGLNFRKVSYAPGLYKIFDEILVNAADNKQRDATMDYVKVEIDQEQNTISVMNDGAGIPVVIHEKERIYVPELIFGHLLTGSNFDDTVKKVTGGRNGLGAKLANIFSTEFTVETVDSERGKKFAQTFSNNMGTRSVPSITSSKSKSSTKITFKPDIARFGMTTLDDDIVALMTKRVYDIAGTNSNLKISLNGERIIFKTFSKYCEHYISDIGRGVISEKVNDRWEICVSLSNGEFQQVSYVNSICTIRGGTHVTHVLKQIGKPLLEQVNKLAKKNKTAELKMPQIKNYLAIFVNCLIENPAFDSQTKETLTTPEKEFGSKCKLSEETLKKILKSNIVTSILEFSRSQVDVVLKKGAGTARKRRLTGIAKLDDANDAGSKNSALCTLILTEGDSAKTLAVSGLSVVGRDHYGVFPLRGKLLNVRDASPKQIAENEEINAIKQILGLQFKREYTSSKELRYGHLMIMTDQDQDGSHIKGLVINFLHTYAPSLLKLDGFLNEFITPLVKAKKGKETKVFYTLPEYRIWAEEMEQTPTGTKGWLIKYYKGLGTSEPAEAKEYFANIDTHQIKFQWEGEKDDELIDMAFNKKRAEDRKDWMRAFKPGTFLDHHALGGELKYSEFINKELILFSISDCERSIPSVVDGLKPAQRKVLFCCFKKNLKTDTKIAQLSGYILDKAAYHHGEVSLQGTIINMAQNFVGSNNYNLLVPAGQFGSRIMGGKDAASARYVMTRLNAGTRVLFNKEDDNILEYLEDDGKSIEPKWYIPVIPMVLVNGAEGIGTGWSTSIPTYDPHDIIANLKRLIKGEEMEPMHPWFRGFTGTVKQNPKKPTQYQISGIWSKKDANTIEITELPVGLWTQNYKEMLESMVTGTEKKPAIVKDYKEYHTDRTVHFVIEFLEGKLAHLEKEGDLEKEFKLNSSLSVANLVAFDPEGRVQKYETVHDIMKEFYNLRKEYYVRRKQYLVDALTEDWEKIDNKVRFILAVVKEEIIVRNRKKADLLKELATKGYKAFPKKKKRDEEEAAPAEEENGEEQEQADSKNGYDYLLSMQLWNLTMERVQKLIDERNAKEAELKTLIGTSELVMWERDLDAFTEAFDAWDEEQKEIASAVPKKGAGRKKAPPKKRKKEDSDDEFENAAKKAKRPAAPKPAATKQEVSPVKTEPKKEAKKPPAKKAAKPTQTSTLDSFLKKEPAKPKESEKEPPAKKTEKPPAKKADSDSEDDLASRLAKRAKADAPPAKAAAPAKNPAKAADDSMDLDLDSPLVVKKTQQKKNIIADSDEDEKPKPAAKKTQQKKNVVADSDEEEKPKAKAAAKKADKPVKPPTAKPEAKKSKKDEDSDMDDVMETDPKKAAEPRGGRNARAKAPVKYSYSDEENASASEAEYMESDSD